MSLGVFAFSQNFLKIIDVLGNLLIIFPFIFLRLRSLFPKTCVIPSCFFVSEDSVVYGKYNIFRYHYEFFVALLTCEFIHGNFVSYGFHSAQSFKHLVCFPLEKQEENLPLLQMRCKGHLEESAG